MIGRARIAVLLMVVATWRPTGGVMAAERNPRAEQVLKLTLPEGTPADDPYRVFMVPVICNGQPAEFELGGYGISRISKRLADQIGAAAVPNEELARHVDPDGKPIYLGLARVDLRFGGREQRLIVQVVTDDHCQKPEKEGILNFDAIKMFQWEVNPAAPTLTLRPPGAATAGKPLAILPLKANPLGYSVRVKVRNVYADVALMPGSSFLQAGPRLQHEWDLNSGKPGDFDVRQYANIRLTTFHGKDGVELARNLFETDFRVALMGDPNHPTPNEPSDSGLGQCVLNRFVYCVDPRRRDMRILRRVERESAPPGKMKGQEADVLKPRAPSDNKPD